MNSLGTGVYQTGTTDPTLKSSASATPTASSGTITRTSSAPAATPSSTVTMGAQATTPYQNVTPPATAIPASQTANNSALSSPVNQSLQMTPAEMSGGAAGIAAYNARIAAANPNLPAPGTTSSTGVTNNVNPSTGLLNQIGVGSAPASSTIGSTGPYSSTTAAGNPSQTGIINQLTSTSAAGSPVASTAASGLLASGTSNPLTSGDAYNAYLTAVNNLAAFKNKVSSQYGAMEQSDLPLPTVLGREAAANQQYASQEDALQQAVTQAQQALGYGIQEQGQQQAGLTSAGNIGNASQGTAQSGLTSAATLNQNSGNFPFVFNPTTGQYTVSGGDLNTAITSGVQQAVSNPTLYSSLDNAIASTYGNAAAGMFQQAYISGGGNPAVAAGIAEGTATGVAATTAAPGQTAAQNAITAGTVGTNTAAANAPAYVQLQQQLANVEGLGNLAVKVGTAGKVNPIGAQFADKTLAYMRSQMSDSDQTNFTSSVAAFLGAASGLLADSTGGTPTSVTNAINSFGSGTLTMGALSALVSQAQAEGNIKLGNAATAATAPGSSSVIGGVGGVNNNPAGI